MSGPRITLITRRFWPLIGGAEKAMADLAVELRELGCRPTILTAQWDRRWPRELTHREIPVVRLAQYATGNWGTLRYMLAVGRWLRSRRDEIDLVYVSTLKHEAYAALGVLENGDIPVALQARGVGKTGDCHWQQTTHFGPRIRRRCQSADAVVTCSESGREELLAGGYEGDRVQVIPLGVTIPSDRSAARQRSARRLLAHCQPDLFIDPQAPLVAFVGRLRKTKGLQELVEAWAPIDSRWPRARLWLVGDGPYRGELEEQIECRGLKGAIVLPGVFDHVDDILQAADLFVLPSPEEGTSLALLEAMAAGLGVIATDTPDNRMLLADGQCGILTPPRDAQSLAEALARMLVERPRAEALGVAARKRVVAEFSLQQTAQKHFSLFEHLVQRRRCSPNP